MRRLPYGVNHLSWWDLPEWRAAIDDDGLFRYGPVTESLATKVEEEFRQMPGARHMLVVGDATQARRLAPPTTRPAVGDRGHLPAATFSSLRAAPGPWAKSPQTVPWSAPRADWKTMRSHHDHGSQRLPVTYPTWQENSFYGENLGVS
ncbi:hypothetical protein OG870_19900 [Streptomyces sp. NBC_00461]|uniref:hypothetical protein n=1 Tax=Streptomyces sp. NBC_00461 TaxID=2975750 RepID=UPI002E188267